MWGPERVKHYFVHLSEFFIEQMPSWSLVDFFVEFFYTGTVLDIKSQYIPEVVVVRRGAAGVLGSGKGGGSTGWGVQTG